uniref:MAT1-2-5 n=1 Tax=Neofusicoccum umdonicola TaxID=643002 RepID=A0A343JZZ7_9PEZI|nr:MAT1-2-5 [Neofusicoccum umdonicola]ATA58207.1 MAT1-2-5 [Neofusicoccum umdonicola]
MEATPQFTLSGLQSDLRHHVLSDKNQQALFNTLDGAVAKIDKSGVLRSEATITQATTAWDLVPMDRSFDYVNNKAVPRKRELTWMKDVLNVERKLADHMSASINDDATVDFLEAIGIPKNGTAEERFRSKALIRVAMRQLLTESTDADLRIAGAVRALEVPRANWTWPSWSAIREERLDAALQAKADARHCPRRELSLIDEIASLEVGIELSAEEDAVVDAIVSMRASEWFEQKQSRLHVAFIALNLPQQYNHHYYEYRIEKMLDRKMCRKRPKPDYYPFKPEHVAENNWGLSKM